MTLYLTEPDRSSRVGVARTVLSVVAQSWLDHVAYINERRLPKTSVAVAVQWCEVWHKKKPERNGYEKNGSRAL